MKELLWTLIGGGTIGHLLMYWSLSIGNKGEVDATTGKEKEGDGAAGDTKFTPEQQKVIDHVVETRLARERAKYADHDELLNFKKEVLQKQDKHAQEELEKAKKYDEAKKGFETQINQHKELVSKKDAEIGDLKVSHALINEINKQNGYAEETLAMIKQTAVLDANGNVTIKAKDSNGIDIQLPIAEGIKKFLEARPYLVKSTHRAGAGSGAGTQQQAANNDQISLNELNEEYAKAMNARDWKKVQEITQKIRGQLKTKGVNV
jgi:hypothetical protein